ncbi:hypothetical protein GJ496_010393 [Pomphorhynchus laevis]|nr:hypothetical protein GJ496_010393 [Pomphorhynchus laevis]
MNDHIVNPLRPGQDLPDVYKQKQNQAEDDLSRDTVRNGLEYRMTEYASEHESLLLQSTFNYNNIGPVLINMMQSTINNKLYASVFNDQNRPKKFAALVKDLFWPAARNLNLSSVWFSELSKLPQSTKINRKVPTFLQKQHILINLFNSNVCPIRSVWYIKMHAAFQFYCLEQKSKKRQTYDAGVDWTKEWVEILKDILNSDARFIDGNSADIPISVSSNDWHSESSVSALLLMELAYTTTSGYSQQMHLAQLPRDQAPITSFVNVKTAINELQRFWQFTSAITFELINQRLVDSYVVFESLMHFLEIPNGQQLNRLRTVKIMHFILKVLPRFTESEILSRRLSVFCSKTISALQDQIHKCVSRSRLILTHDSLTPTSSSSNMSPQTNSSVNITSNDLTVCSPSSVSSPNVAPLSSQAAAASKDTNKSCFLINDLHLFSSVLQLILIKCPQSQVWSKPPSSVEGTLANKDGSSFLLEKQKALLGSSLDLVKFQPSDLALDSNLLSTKQSHLIRKHLRFFENNIKQRSMMVERKWTSDNFDENVDYSLIHMLISIYDVLIIDEISSTGEAIEVQIDQSFAQTLSSHVFLNFSINAKMIVIKHLFDLCLCADADFSQRRNFLCAALLKKLLYSAKTLSSDMFDSVNCCILVVLRDLIVDLSLKILNSVKDCDLNDLRILYKKPEVVKLLFFCAILLYMDVVNYTSLIWKILNTKHICSSYIWNADHFTNRCTLQTESFVQDSHSSIKSNFDSRVNSGHHEELSRLILFMLRSIPLTFYGLRPNTLPCYRNYTLFSFKNGRHIFDTRIKEIEMHRRAVVKMLFSRICTTICCSCASCDACYHGRTFDFESWWLQFDKFHIGLYLFDCFQTISSLLYRILRYLCEHPTPWDSCVCDYFYKQQHNDSALLTENDPVDFDTKKSSLSTSYCDFLEERNLRIKQLTNFLTELGAVYEYSNVNYLFFKFAVQFLMLSVSRICGKDVSKNYIPPPTKIKIDNSLEECNKLWLDLINFSVRYLHEHLDVLLFDPSGVMLVDIAECILHYLASETDVCSISLVDFLIELYANSFAVKNFIVTNKFDLFTGILTKHSFRCIDIKSNCLFLQLQKNSNFADASIEPT